MSILYDLHRINEVCKEHVENNFLPPLPVQYAADFAVIRTRIETLFNDTLALTKSGDIDTVATLRRHCDEIRTRYRPHTIACRTHTPR